MSDAVMAGRAQFAFTMLWLLMGRGIGFEFRHAHPSPLWKGFWDTVFSGSSLLLALLFGVAVANVLRGVPFDAQGEFQGSFSLLLNPFALAGGLLSVAVLCLHGAAFLAMKTEGALQARARRLSGSLWLAVLLLLFGFVTASFMVREGFASNFSHMPVLVLLPLVATGALSAIPVFLRRAQDGRMFAATSVLIASLLGSAAAGLFPRLLPPLGNHPAADLTIYNAASGNSSLVPALVMNLIGMSGVLAYTLSIYKFWSGKVQIGH